MIIDILYCILMMMAVFKGYRRGFIVSVFSFIAIIIGLAAALKLSALVAGWLSNSTNINVKWLPLLSFALVMIAVILLVKAGAALIETSVKMLMLGFLNKLAGILLYAVLYTIIYSVILFYAIQMQVLKPETTEASYCYHYIEPFAPRVINAFGAVIPIFKDLFTQLEKFFSSLAQTAS